MGQQSAGFVDDAQSPRPHFEAQVNILVAVPERFIETAHVEVEFAWNRQTRAGHDVEIALHHAPGMVPGLARQQMIGRDSVGPQPRESHHDAGVL